MPEARVRVIDNRSVPLSQQSLDVGRGNRLSEQIFLPLLTRGVDQEGMLCLVSMPSAITRRPRLPANAMVALVIATSLGSFGMPSMKARSILRERMGRFLRNHQELIAAQTRQEIALAHAIGQARGRLLEQFVANLVP